MVESHEQNHQAHPDQRPPIIASSGDQMVVRDILPPCRLRPPGEARVQPRTQQAEHESTLEVVREELQRAVERMGKTVRGRVDGRGEEDEEETQDFDLVSIEFCRRADIVGTPDSLFPNHVLDRRAGSIRVLRVTSRGSTEDSR